tara:strand:- start:27 stop:347 length:321 start_codon:yes stop_codon:yes gene_type:complete
MSVLNLSGSADIKSLIEELEKIVDDRWVEDNLAESCKPTYVLQFDKEKSSLTWLYSEARRSFAPFPWGITLEPLDLYAEDDSNVPCMIGHDLVLVPPDYIIDVGWN